MIDVNHVDNYRPCTKKYFEMFVCMPLSGVYTLESWVAAKYSAKRLLFTQEIRSDFEANLKKLVAKGEVQVTTPQAPFVLCDPVMKDFQVVSAMELSQEFTFMSNGRPVPIDNASLSARMEYGQLPWTVVRSSQASLFGKFAACFVPHSIRGWLLNGYTQRQEPYNAPGILHGKGDFIVCPLINNAPNMNARYVVNGESFRETYNNKGWSDFLGREPERLTIDMLPSYMSPFLWEVLTHCGGWDDLSVYNPCYIVLTSSSHTSHNPQLCLAYDKDTGRVIWIHFDNEGVKTEGQCDVQDMGGLISMKDGAYKGDRRWDYKRAFSMDRRCMAYG